MLPKIGNGFGPGTSLYGLGAVSALISNVVAVVFTVCWWPVSAPTTAACGHVA